ncbi:hypothetical protein RRG08_016160 [Elysia crispata]|uniref:Uncharacterized protein n=1 Tax=Elysia crispata TaxID=231223 RepID=A0AAE1D9V9_9GAST|nr:hypothetical protein RRG08_016160 [Elysia crispata]
MSRASPRASVHEPNVKCHEATNILQKIEEVRLTERSRLEEITRYKGGLLTDLTQGLEFQAAQPEISRRPSIWRRGSNVLGHTAGTHTHSMDFHARARGIKNL